MFFAGYFVSAWVVEDHEVGHLLETLDQSDTLSHMMLQSVKAWKGAHPHVFLFCLLPPLLFEDASSMDFYTLKKVLSASVLLAGPGVLLSMLLTAGATFALFGFGEPICYVRRPHTNRARPPLPRRPRPDRATACLCAARSRAGRA